MKKLLFMFSAVLLLTVMSGFESTESLAKFKKFVGSWEYQAPQAPYEYQKGVMNFTKEGKELKGNVEVMGSSIPLNDIQTEKRHLSGYFYVQGEKGVISLDFEKNIFKGTASYSQGSLELLGTRKE